MRKKPEDQKLIQAASVTRHFEDIVAVDNVSLDVPKGTILGMVGPNGAGKTTLVRMMIGILRPTNGACFIDGIQSNRLTPEQRARTGYMTQLKSLYPDLTARENLEFFAESYGVKSHQRRKELIERAATLTQITESLDRTVQVLSGGTIQRVSLACAIVHEPDVIFLDEPTVGVSPDLRMEFWDHFHKLSKEGKTIVMTTHYLDEATRCDKVAMIFEGKLIAHGPPEELISALPLESTISGTIDAAHAKELESALENIAPVEIKGNRFFVLASNSDVKFRVFQALTDVKFQMGNLIVKQPGLEEAFTYHVRRSRQ
ncbi:MAG: ABC transporter ATP-binding protein [Candidatus Thorarchaeota archaeon]